MSKTNKELISELTIAYITSFNAKSNSIGLNCDAVKEIYNTFKELV